MSGCPVEADTGRYLDDCARDDHYANRVRELSRRELLGYRAGFRKAEGYVRSFGFAAYVASELEDSDNWSRRNGGCE